MNNENDFNKENTPAGFTGENGPAPETKPYVQTGYQSPYGYNPYQPQGGYYPSQPFPQAEPPKKEKAPKRPMGNKAIIALALACALVGGAIGGVAGGLANPPAAVVANAVVTGESKPSGDTVVGPTQIPVIKASDGALSLSEVYENALPSIAGISIEGTTANAFGQLTPLAATGSGFVVSEDGYILTNSHVIDGASTVTVRLGEKSYKAEIIGSDTETEVAVLKIEGQGLAPVTFGDSDSLRVGDMVLAIGNPLGQYVDTLTVGYISALDRLLNIDGKPINMLQTDAAINPGNSGGPLFNLNGEVIGITTAKSSGTGIEGIGFALPINDVIKTMDLLIQYGYPKGRAQLGISVYGVDEDYSDYSGIPTGVYVSSVESGSCADRAGVKKGDIVISLGSHRVTTVDELFSAKLYYMAGETSTITIMRNGSEMTLSITFDEKAREDEQQPQQPQQPQPQQEQEGRQGENGGYFPFEDIFPFR